MCQYRESKYIYHIRIGIKTTVRVLHSVLPTKLYQTSLQFSGVFMQCDSVCLGLLISLWHVKAHSPNHSVENMMTPALNYFDNRDLT